MIKPWLLKHSILSLLISKLTRPFKFNLSFISTCSFSDLLCTNFFQSLREDCVEIILKPFNCLLLYILHTCMLMHIALTKISLTVGTQTMCRMKHAYCIWFYTHHCTWTSAACTLHFGYLYPSHLQQIPQQVQAIDFHVIATSMQFTYHHCQNR